MFNMTPTYYIQRSDPTDPCSALLFTPPKGSDELHEALKVTYPQFDNLQARMRAAVIDFYLYEQQQESMATQFHNSPTVSDHTSPDYSFNMTPFTTTEMSFPNTPQISHDTSPELMSFSLNSLPSDMPSLFPQVSAASQPSTTSPATDAHAAMPTQEELSTVWALPSRPEAKVHKRRCMTAAEKLAYKQKRVDGACADCKRRRRKCKHNSNPSTPSSSSGPSSTAKRHAARAPSQRPPSIPPNIDFNSPDFGMNFDNSQYPDFSANLQFEPMEMFDFTVDGLFENEMANMTAFAPHDEIVPLIPTFGNLNYNFGNHQSAVSSAAASQTSLWETGENRLRSMRQASLTPQNIASHNESSSQSLSLSTSESSLGSSSSQAASGYSSSSAGTSSPQSPSPRPKSIPDQHQSQSQSLADPGPAPGIARLKSSSASHVASTDSGLLPQPAVLQSNDRTLAKKKQRTSYQEELVPSSGVQGVLRTLSTGSLLVNQTSDLQLNNRTVVAKKKSTSQKEQQMPRRRVQSQDVLHSSTGTVQPNQEVVMQQPVLQRQATPRAHAALLPQTALQANGRVESQKTQQHSSEKTSSAIASRLCAVFPTGVQSSTSNHLTNGSAIASSNQALAAPMYAGFADICWSKSQTTASKATETVALAHADIQIALLQTIKAMLRSSTPTASNTTSIANSNASAKLNVDIAVQRNNGLKSLMSSLNRLAFNPFRSKPLSHSTAMPHQALVSCV
jgi:hypothetical protein